MGAYSRQSWRASTPRAPTRHTHTGRLGISELINSNYSRRCSPSLNRDPTTGIPDKHLPLAQNCHVFQTAHFVEYKYWSLVRFQPTVDNWQKSNQSPILNYVSGTGTCICVPTSRLYLTNGQVTCVWKIFWDITPLRLVKIPTFGRTEVNSSSVTSSPYYVASEGR
jgi:hypothetical protein